MAAIPHRTKTGVRHEMSGAGFHTPAKYTKNDRLNKKELNDILEEEMYDFEDETGNGLGIGVHDAADLFYKERGRMFGPGLHKDGTPLEHFDVADIVAVFEAGYKQAEEDNK